MDFIEKVGNAMPDPVSLFIILAIVVVILSAILGSMGYSAVHPGTGKTIQVINLLTKDGFRDMYSKAVSNYSGFAPLLFGYDDERGYGRRQIVGCNFCHYFCCH